MASVLAIPRSAPTMIEPLVAIEPPRMTLTLHSMQAVAKRIFEICDECKSWTDPLSCELHIWKTRAQGVDLSDLSDDDLDNLSKDIDELAKKLINSIDEAPLVSPTLICNKFVVEPFMVEEWKELFAGANPIDNRLVSDAKPHYFAACFLEALSPFASRFAKPRQITPLPPDASKDDKIRQAIKYNDYAERAFTKLNNQETRIVLNLLEQAQAESNDREYERLESRAKEIELQLEATMAAFSSRLEHAEMTHQAENEIHSTEIGKLKTDCSALAETVETEVAHRITLEAQVTKLRQELNCTRELQAHYARKSGGGKCCCM
ncbi:MAG: hypothetical protein K9M07_02120 [Simkaniaceae bacterium]|nr:hypothetical protein [Simkaniaceae bacterium]MCF7852018.1 hypothetical protein [Simkaniaceae bacterium]